MMSADRRFLAVLFVSLYAVPLLAEDYVPQPGQFPPPGTSTYLAGELVLIDAANRRGGLRLDGNEPHDLRSRLDPPQVAAREAALHPFRELFREL